MARLRLGTRGSALALAQTRLVARALASLDPAVATDIVVVETRGDRDRRTPLSEINDPRFFSAELDEALLANEVDACVHSLKDLPPTPPAGIRRAALFGRADPHDVIVFRSDVPARLADGAEELAIGSSSARRQAFVADFLREALPRAAGVPELRFSPLRGPVDARLGRLAVSRDRAEALDGVVLALAGLARLWDDEETRPLVAPLLEDRRWMVLPLGECPVAPGQGALVVECRADDAATLAALERLHDPACARLLAREQAALRTLPESQREDAGATAVPHDTLGEICFLRGAAGNEVGEPTVHWDMPGPPPRAPVPFDGIAWQRLCTREYLAPSPDWSARPAVFVAYWHAAESVTLPPDARIWTSGTGSWRRLARRGLWVEGCGDHLGFASLRPLLRSPVLGLPPLPEWTVLTHTDAVSGWQDSGTGRVIGTYRILPPTPGPDLAAVEAEAARASHCYWSSPDQFHALRDVVNPEAEHACGAGKTLASLARAGQRAQPFPDGQAWRRWLATATDTAGAASREARS